MPTTGATSLTSRPQGGVGPRKVVAAVFVILLLFAGFFATAQRAGADTGIPASGAVGTLVDSAAGVPPGSTAVPPPAAGTGVPEAPVDLAPPAAQDAATTQAATADAAAAQPQQSNAAGTARTDSPGGESALQQNDVSVVGAAANTASTGQTPGAGGPADDGATQTGQQAATDQAANAAAAAAQPQQSNVVIIIRINSPGDDVVSQTNVVSVAAVAANQGWTSQTPTPAGVTPTPTTDPAQSSPSTSSAPSPSGQPVDSGGRPATLQQQPTEEVQQLHPRAVHALSILAFSASSTVTPAPEHRATSPTPSAGHPRLGGAARRSGAFGPSATAAEGSDRAAVDSDRPSIQTPRAQVQRTDSQRSRGTTIGAVRNWLDRTGVAARPPLAADSADGMNLGVLTLTALLVGLLAWAALSWPPFSRR
jgi:hypothetical protein